MPPNKARKPELRLCFSNSTELVSDYPTNQEVGRPSRSFSAHSIDCEALMPKKALNRLLAGAIAGSASELPYVEPLPEEVLFPSRLP